MADLDAVVNGLMRDVGAALRPLGFRGSGGIWRLVQPHGVAVLEKQGSTGSSWSEKVFYLNSGVVPRPWWEWNNSAGPIEKAREYQGLRLLGYRVACADPAHAYRGEDTSWLVTAGTDVDRLRADLVDAVARTGARLAELLAPGRYLDELLATPDKHLSHWRPIVVLLADRGPSPELEAACAALRDSIADAPHVSPHVEKVIAWARARAQAR